MVIARKGRVGTVFVTSSHVLMRASQEQPRVDFDAMTSALPAFITAPSRAFRLRPLLAQAFLQKAAWSALRSEQACLRNAPKHVAPGGEEGENRFHLRPRRRRRVRSETGDEGGDAAPLPETSSAD